MAEYDLTKSAARRLNKFAERRFLLPAMVVVIGAAFVPFAFLTGQAWAAMATTLTTAYLGLAGWTRSSEAQVEVVEAATKRNQT